MNTLHYGAVLFIGVLIGFTIVAILQKGADQGDRDRIDLIEQQGLTILADSNNQTWGVISHGVLLATGKDFRAVLDNALSRSA